MSDAMQDLREFLGGNNVFVSSEKVLALLDDIEKQYMKLPRGIDEMPIRPGDQIETEGVTRSAGWVSEDSVAYYDTDRFGSAGKIVFRWSCYVSHKKADPIEVAQDLLRGFLLDYEELDNMYFDEEGDRSDALDNMFLNYAKKVLECGKQEQ